MVHEVLRAPLHVGMIGWPWPMHRVFGRRLAPMATLLFALGGLAGWSAVTAMRGCATVDPAEPSTSGGGESAGRLPTGGGEGEREEPEAGDETRPSEVSRNGSARQAPPIPSGVPRGRAIGALERDECFALLEAADIAHDREPMDDAVPQVAAPLRLEGPVADVTYTHVGRSAKHELMDCRLALALLRWGPVLRAAGVRRVEHMSVFRPDARVNGTAKPSAHATALAIDAARFHFEDGTELDVLEDWADKARGAPPCEERDDEPEAQALLRGLVCDAVELDLFQVVITPHHNRAHHNHVHLELVPDVDWTYVR